MTTRVSLAIHPSEHIADELEARGMTAAELARTRHIALRDDGCIGRKVGQATAPPCSCRAGAVSGMRPSVQCGQVSVDVASGGRQAPAGAAVGVSHDLGGDGESGLLGRPPAEVEPDR